ncbi:ribosome-binding protein 1 [Esox lucius]|uniref:ribosome-binding protein 1 n=1 Tax=Esox lucius TaxID=8010 RepID=UPI001476FF8F|nr:ribosome-binding protein 1 [Esox lucius]
MAMPPVASLKTAAKGQDAKGQDAKGQDAKGQDAKGQEPSKKKASGKKKTKPEADPGLDSPLSLPYKALVSSVSSMAFSEAEAQRLIDLLSDKAGLGQDTWHKTTPKGDPVAVLKKQLEENQKQLAAQQEDAAAAKTKLRELTRELSAEKTKVTGVETRLSSQLSSREQEMIALQARMQASYQDHLAQTQNLNTKILSLQEQLESGPTAQLTRLQQENSILRDALNQATSQAESKQNAELAKLRLDCSRLTKELGEKSVSLQAEEKVKRSLEAKTSAAEKQLAQLQASHAESKQALERRLEEVSEELRSSQSTLEKAQQEAAVLSDLQIRLGSLEADLKERSAKVDALTAQLGQTELEKRQLEDQVGSINVLLEASQNKEDHSTQLEQLKSSLQHRDSQLMSLQEELKQLKEIEKEAVLAAEVSTAVTVPAPSSEDTDLVASLQEELKHLREELDHLQNTPTASAQDSGETEQLLQSLKERESQVRSLEEEVKQLRKTSEQLSDRTAELAALQTSLSEREALMTSLQEELQEARNQSETMQRQESQQSTELPELLEKLKEAEDSHSTLHAECDQYRTVLAETEGMLKDLQKSVEEEELVWKSKMADSQDQLAKALGCVHTLEMTTERLKAENQSIGKLKEQVMLLEAQLEKQSEIASTEEEMEQMKGLLSEHQSQLTSAQEEARTYREELVMVRGQLSEATELALRQKAVPEARSQNSQSESEVQSQLIQTTEEFEQAQKAVVELQTQLDLLKDAGDAAQTDMEDVALLKERLQKERKLSKDLGLAATKLQQLLKFTQEQLVRERARGNTIQEPCVEAKGESIQLKEGTSV